MLNPGAHRDRVNRAVAREVRMLIAGHDTATISSIAEAIDVRRATLSHRVNGHGPFDPWLLIAVATQLGTTAPTILARAEQALADMQSAEPARPVAETPEPSRQATTDPLRPSARSARAHRIPTAS